MARRRVTLLSWNVENLVPYLDGASDRPALRRVVAAVGRPAIVCLQEIRVRPRDTALVDAMTRALPGYDCQFREGRVVLTELPARRLLAANVYAVNGTAKPYFDHERGRIVGDRHAFKRRFNRRLMRALLAERARGLDLLLVGDWNISRTRLLRI